MDTVDATKPSRLRRNGAICAAALAACALGQLFHAAGVPVGQLFGGMAVGLAVALAPSDGIGLPRPLYSLAQALLGAAIGSLARAGISASPSIIAAFPVLVVATILLSLGAGTILYRRARVGRGTALLGMVAGGSAGVVAVADDVDADARLVAAMQYLRVALVALTIPLVAAVLQTHGHRHVAVDVSSVGDNAGSVAALLAVALAGWWLARRVHLPAAALAGPLLLGALLGWGGVLPDAPVPPVVTAVALSVIGLEIGLRFDRAAVGTLRRMAGVVSALTFAMMVGCAALAVLLSLAAGVPPVDAYLMTTPGGINAALAAAVSLNGVNLPLVTLAQILRLLAMVIIAPRLIRRMARV